MVKKILLLFLVFAGCFWLSPVLAQTYYYDYIEVDIFVKEDSTFDVIERQTYYLDGSFGYLFRDVELKDLDHILYCIVLDRRGGSDILCTDNDYGTKEFETILKEIGKVYDYKPTRGLWSDTDILSDLLCCANLSVGYYNPHQK